jgi:hypothetical protein
MTLESPLMEQEEEEVIVYISGRAKVHRYDPDSDTFIVKNEMLQFYGLGELQNRKNGRGIGTSKIKAGEYDYHITEQTQQQQTGKPLTLFFNGSSYSCSRLSHVYSSSC